MRVSSRADYGVRALFDLALHFGQGPIQSRDIAARQDVPEAYLHQVLGALSRAGLVKSTRGPLGGHELLRQPGTITLWEVLSLLDGPDRRRHPDPHERVFDPVHETWQALREQTRAFLEQVTLQTLVERELERHPPVNYAI